MNDVWRGAFAVEGKCWTSRRGIRRRVPLPTLFDVGCQTYLEREPPDAKAILRFFGMRSQSIYPMVGFSLDLDPTVEPWTLVRLDLTSPTMDVYGNTTIGLRMQPSAAWLTAGEQLCTATSGDFAYAVTSTRDADLWRLLAAPPSGERGAPWLTYLELTLRTEPASEWPWEGLHITLRSDAESVASLNADVSLSPRR